MKEIFLGVAAAAAFLVVWLIGGNLLISALSSAACLGIVVLTIKALEKEKKVRIDLKGDDDAYGKVHQGIMDHSSAMARYMDQLKRLNVEKDILVMLSSIHKTCLKIAEALEEDHSLYTKLNDFSLYYLPGLMNILNTYENLAEGSFKTEEAQKFAGQFSLFLPQITDAFDKKYYSLFSKDVLDSKAEMAAMAAVFKSEGLMDNKDFMGGGS
ncbi:5-bromo-4-chloroindolyl phosphate hydrolysis protein [Desulfitobacterium dehalogenans ATCC 51507]|uniref:5-bromo-4-chloroindolyl phosphate hydrolysis protein n=1 Tax=Desulfitobacterium dehalogenans (strain ATCC 51507 / DSM 9161 / JW/IU-DC1) TaxID=756499 RepID=I4AE98_DESDJ|nr:5-bromo-4-chloroindolyl phosphate hydrolysis family protein [Desulfitobacterium dehalogenans]AFM02283.1 5-bromo-4-chloroindolyl phosphate hydrolysis protein [Desulfitobacterium dehalogenans ATCC 51507]